MSVLQCITHYYEFSSSRSNLMCCINALLRWRISAMVETTRDPCAARWNRIHEWNFQLRIVHTTIFHYHTLGMIWCISTNRYRGTGFMTRPLLNCHKLFSLHLLWCSLIAWESYIRHICGFNTSTNVCINSIFYGWSNYML